MNRPLGFLFVFSLTLIAACSGTQDAVNSLRPSGSPDVVILSVSGQAGIVTPPDNCSFATNRAYLGDTNRAVSTLANLLGGLGFFGSIGNYASRLENGDLDSDGVDDPDREGFVQLLEDLNFIYDNWIDGFINPTAIIIVSHGHGAVWAHAAVAMLDQIPIAYLITLDGFCTDWDCVHETAVADYQTANANPFPFDMSDPCARWTVVGEGTLFDSQDIAFDNVTFHLEVRSNEMLDVINNRRLDGTEDSIFRFTSTEDHDGITMDGSDAMDWVANFIDSVEG